MTEDVILLVEDKPNDVALTRRAFEKNGLAHPLVVAEDGQEALDYLFGAGEHYDRALADLPVLALLDLKLPRVDSLEVLRRMSADPRTRRIPVVILTSSTEKQDIAAGYELGANSYIRKPVDFQPFAEAVKHLGLYCRVVNEPPPKR